jgi:serine/threonine protein phosphatase 1
METLKLPANDKGRDFVVSDLHGYYDEFQRQLELVRFDPAVDRVLSVGDLVDRGPDSRKCAGLLYEPWFRAVRGNHEQMLIDSLVYRYPQYVYTSIRNGGVWAFNASEDPDVKKLLKRFDKLPYAIVVGEGESKYNIVHAEFLGSQAELERGHYTERQKQQMLWGRSLLTMHGSLPPGFEMPQLAPTYVGHSIVPSVLRLGPFRFIDTGMYDGGQLTLLQVELE